MAGKTSKRDIADALRAEIRAGELAAGARLPSRAQLVERFGVAPQTVVNALNGLRSEGLVRSVTGSGYYVRTPRPVIRNARTRLSAAERDAGRGAFSTDADRGGWSALTQVEVRVEAADDDIAAELDIRPGEHILVRDRVMSADGEPVQLATSRLPYDLATPAMAASDTGPGGLYARLAEANLAVIGFTETVRVGHASEHEAGRLQVATGTPVLRIDRTAHGAARTLETNAITLLADGAELVYELPAD